MYSFSTSPAALVRSILANRSLIGALSIREISARYRGSVLGFTWAVVQPIFMLTIYTFVFSEVFKGRWPGGTGSKAEFALVLFSGLLVFNMFSDVFSRAPEMILANTNYVKRVVFPLEILPVVSVLTALFNFAVSLVIWMGFYWFAIGTPHASAFLVCAVVVPFLIFLVGISWIFAALGVYLRDIAQVTAIISTALMFLTPIFFPTEAIPERFRWLLNFNPLAPPVNELRDVLIWNTPINMIEYFSFFAVSIFIFFIGFAFFQKVRKGFADVL